MVIVKSVRLTKFDNRAAFDRRESIDYDHSKGNKVSFSKMQKLNCIIIQMYFIEMI